MVFHDTVRVSQGDEMVALMCKKSGSGREKRKELILFSTFILLNVYLHWI